MKNYFSKTARAQRASQKEAKDEREEALSYAVLDKISPELNGLSCKCTHYDNLYDGTYTQKDLDRQRALISDYRTWIKEQKGVTDDNTLKQYTQWMDFFDGRAKEAQKIIDSGERQKYLKDSTKIDPETSAYEAKEARIEALAKKIKVPKAPI